MKQGKIIKGIGGFYYVHTGESGVYECRAKGIFRRQNMKPMVGDMVRMEVISESEKTGNVADILPRKNALIRPAVANVDQAVVIFAAASPQPNLNLLDRFLVMMEQQEVPSVIAFNKADLAAVGQLETLEEAYRTTGYPVFFLSAQTGRGVEELQKQLAGKTSTLAGPSGVGKSTLINLLAPEAGMETGEISEKIQRGRHTTRHSELIALDKSTYLFDTPGFSSLSVDYGNATGQQAGNGVLCVEKENLADFFPEFSARSPYCRFAGCSHTSEPGCAVRGALACGEISKSRYENYLQIYGELKNKKKY